MAVQYKRQPQLKDGEIKSTSQEKMNVQADNILVNITKRKQYKKVLVGKPLNTTNYFNSDKKNRDKNLDLDGL